MTVTATSIRRARSAGTTPKQRAVLAAIVELTAARRYPPSIRGLADHLGVNVNDVYQKIVRLQRDGLVEWDPGVCRSLRVREVTA
jgi:DNA-binding MarR family transcriptional regulator